MAKKSMIERDRKRSRMTDKYANKRAKLKAIIYDKETPMEERFKASMQLDKLPSNSSKVRQRNRCAMTGRPRGHYRKFNLSRLVLRKLAQNGQLPGVTKSSW